MSGTLLSLGHGYSARALARRLLPQGWRVIGTTRSAARAAALAAEGVEGVVWPGTPLGPLLAQATHLLSSIAPGPGGDPVIAAERAALAAAGHLRWAGYLSTTAVYGDHAGAWVDEETPPAPSTPRGRARLEAERAWTAVAAEAGFPLAIFRLAGIYGPGRGPFAKIRDGSARRIVKPGQVFSRIHVEDIATVLIASMARPPARVEIYNVCDDAPAPPEEVLADAAALLGLPPPPALSWEEAEAGLSEMARSFYAESKRVRNSRLARDLGVRLAYPSWREGLAATLAAEAAGDPLCREPGGGGA